MTGKSGRSRKLSWAAGSIVLCLIACAACVGAEEGQTAARDQFAQVLQDMEALLGRQLHERVETRNREIFAFIAERIEGGELDVVITGPADFYESIRFYLQESRPTLAVSTTMLSNHFQSFSLCMTLLIRSFNQCYVYFCNEHSYNEIARSKLYNLLIDLDSYYLAGSFLDDHVDKPWKITQFEDFLIFTVRNNDLNGLSQILLGYDLGMANEIYRINMEYGNDEGMVLRELLSLAQSRCEPAVAGLEAAGDEYDKLGHLLVLHSFCDFSRELLSWVYQSELDLEDIARIIPDFGACLKKYAGYVEAEDDFMQRVPQRLRQQLGLPY